MLITSVCCQWGEYIPVHEFAEGPNIYFKVRDEVAVKLAKSNKFHDFASNDRLQPKASEVALG